MVKARLRRRNHTATFSEIEGILRGVGVDPTAFGFYDQPAFVKLERLDPVALELYSSWVLLRPRDPAYDEHVRTTVSTLVGIIEEQLRIAQALGTCVNVVTAMARMLDRLGVWSFAVRGSLTIEIPSNPGAGRRYFPECEMLTDPDAVSGHGWLVAPPFLVIDPSLRHQKWVDLDPAISALLPPVVAAESGAVVRPRWFDVVGDSVLLANRIAEQERNDDLPYRVKPDLERIERSLPGRDVRLGELSLRYIPGSVTLSELPLEKIPSLDLSSPELVPIALWSQHVAPVFNLGS